MVSPDRHPEWLSNRLGECLLSPSKEPGVRCKLVEIEGNQVDDGPNDASPLHELSEYFQSSRVIGEVVGGM